MLFIMALLYFSKCKSSWIIKINDKQSWKIKTIKMSWKSFENLMNELY